MGKEEAEDNWVEGQKKPGEEEEWGRRLETDDAPDKERPQRCPGGRFDYGEEEGEGFVCEEGNTSSRSDLGRAFQFFAGGAVPLIGCAMHVFVSHCTSRCG